MRARPRRRLAGGVAGAVAILVLIASQLFLPSYAEQRIEERLTASGGSAAVHVVALPAIRLIGRDGDALEIDASGLSLPVESNANSLASLDRFERVSIHLRNVTVGAIRVSDFLLTRSSSGASYALAFHGLISSQALADLVRNEIGPLGVIFGGLPSDSTAHTSRVQRIELNLELESIEGEPRLVGDEQPMDDLPLALAASIVGEALAARLEGL